MSPRSTLVFMACSMTKVATPTPLPAMELYDGPLWQTLRTHLGGIPPSNVCVMSAKYGFISALARVTPYDANMTAGKAAHVIARGVLGHNDRFGAIKPGRMPGTHPLAVTSARDVDTVIISASGHYLRALSALLGGFTKHGVVRRGAKVMVTQGMIGKQRRQLGCWLREVNGWEDGA